MLKKLKYHYYRKGVKHGIANAIILLYSQDPKLAEDAADTIGSIGTMWITKRMRKSDAINLYRLCEDEIERLKSSK